MSKYEPFPIFSRHIPLGSVSVLRVVFKVIGSPLKHTDSCTEDPPKAVQKSDFDCQISVNLVVRLVAWVCMEAAKGELTMEVF
jgi:hypothetical protein